MSGSLVISPAANQDIELAMEWYDGIASDLGDRFIVALQSRFEDILSAPLAPRLLAGRPVRRIYLKGWPYFIYYRIKEEKVRVIAVIHTSRDTKYISSRIR